MPAADDALTTINERISEEGLRAIAFVTKQVFPADAQVFLRFAMEDIKSGDVRGLTNALGNAKRAIENRVDTLLFANGLRRRAQREQWNFPTKRERLKQLGISAPDLLQKMVTKRRNLLEHEYVIPRDAAEVQDIIDIADMYLGHTEKYIDRGFVRLAIGPSDVDLTGIGETDYLTPALGRFSILLDNDGDSLTLTLEDFHARLRFRDIAEEELRRLMRSIRTLSTGEGVKVVGPMDENEFSDLFFSD